MLVKKCDHHSSGIASRGGYVLTAENLSKLWLTSTVSSGSGKSGEMKVAARNSQKVVKFGLHKTATVTCSNP